MNILMIPALNIYKQTMDPYVPMGLLSLQAIAQKKDTRVDIYIPSENLSKTRFYSAGDFIREVMLSMNLGDYDILGLSTICSSYHHSLRIAEQAKTINPEIQIMLGGPHASAVSDQVLNHYDCIDAICIGEGELAFAALIDAIKMKSLDFNKIPGFKTRTGTYSSLGLFDNLDKLPFIDTAHGYMPAYNLVKNVSQKFDIPIEAARGCQGKCKFCSTRRTWGRSVRRKTPDRLILEMYRLKDLTGSGTFTFIGDNFATPIKELLNFCEVMDQEQTKFEWDCSFRLDTIKLDQLELIWKGGCRAFFVGVESASQDTINKIGKKVNLKKELEIIKEAVANGFRVTTSFMIGFPWETLQDIRNTYELHCKLLNSGVYNSQVHIVCPIPGTELLSQDPILFDHWTSGVALDDIPWDEEIHAFVQKTPEVFYQMGYYQTPHLTRVEVKAVRDAAELLASLHRRN